MSTPLHVLIVEDLEDDAALLLRQLRRGGYEPVWERVDTAEAMRSALQEGTWDVVIADYSMPRFSAPAALALLKEFRLDVPFIVVSGTVGEDVAVATMKAGAHDYLMKDNLTRLAPAVERELRELEVHMAKKQAEAALALRVEELSRSNAELERFNRLAVGRELRMIELKREVNDLLGELGRDGLYDLTFAETGGSLPETAKGN